MRRGEIWWADLGQPRGSAPAFRRPVLIVSADSFNGSTIRAVTVIILTTNLNLAKAPGNFVVPARGSGLREDLVANVSQITAVDKGNVTQRVGRLQERLMPLLADGLSLALDLQ